MTNLLDGLRADVTAALAGTLRTGTLWQYSLGEDEYGGTVVVYDTSYTCEGVTGTFDAVMSSLAGIPATDAKIELLAGTLPVEPKRLDKIYFEGAWWQVRELSVDPARAVWTCQCFETSPVTP